MAFRRGRRRRYGRRRTGYGFSRGRARTRRLSGGRRKIRRMRYPGKIGYRL